MHVLDANGMYSCEHVYSQPKGSNQQSIKNCSAIKIGSQLSFLNDHIYTSFRIFIQGRIEFIPNATSNTRITSPFLL